MAVSITPVVMGAAINGPPPPAPSMYKKAICLPSCDQRGRAAYPLRLVSFFAPEPLAFNVQSCRCSFCLGLEKNASVLESGAHTGSKSDRSPVFEILTSCAGVFPDNWRM